ncbi:MAG: hypothetical protein JXN64_07905 [Spirochaetes bacterium]|nr:hypothetical protein [Spirochaetota bacterium]
MNTTTNLFVHYKYYNLIKDNYSFGFMYLAAILDLYSRKVLSWRPSNRLDVYFCIEALHEAVDLCGKPEIFNSRSGQPVYVEGFNRLA